MSTVLPLWHQLGLPQTCPPSNLCQRDLIHLCQIKSFSSPFVENCGIAAAAIVIFVCPLVHQTKEEMAGTVEAVQALQVQSGHLQKSKEVYHAKCLELDRLRKEGAPLKELEKVSRKVPALRFRPPPSRVAFLPLRQPLFLLSSPTRRS